MPKRMKAAVLHVPRKIQIEERQIPKIKDGQLLTTKVVSLQFQE